MMIILQYGCDAVQSDLLQAPKENSFAFFRRRWRDDPRHPISISGPKPTQREEMKQLLKMTAAPATALFALAFVAMATPASASPNEYCRTDVTSAMRSCSFSTMEQCQAMSSGRGGTCARDPFLADTRGAYAYQPKHPHSKSAVRPAKQPVDNQ
jgi:hypothetical protein